MTIFAPAAKHFLVHASALSLAPFAPHLSSLTHPLTVVLLPMSSKAKAVRANTKHNARHSTRIFLMADFLLVCVQTAEPTRRYGRNSNRTSGSNCTPPRPSINVPNYTTAELGECHAL